MAFKIGGNKARKLIEKGALLIDTRDAVAFRDGSLPNAKNLTLRQLSAILVKQPRTTPLIFFGESFEDPTIQAAINYAEQFGFTGVHNLGTKDNWEQR